MPRRLGKRIATFVAVAWILFAPSVSAGVLYAFEKPLQPPHFLMGTMHSDDPQVLALLDKVRPYMQQADVIVQEVAPDMASMLASAKGMLLPADTHLEALLGKELYAQAVAMGKRKKLPELVLRRLKPWAVAVTLGTPLPRGDILDQAIYKWALKANKTVLSLETADEQLQVFEELSLEQQRRMVRDVIENEAHLQSQFEQMKAAYLQGDLDKLQRLSLEYESAGDKALLEWFKRKVLLERNRRMQERLLQHIENGRLFVAVGALHLPGEDGLLALLRQAGYRVRAIEMDAEQ